VGQCGLSVDNRRLKVERQKTPAGVEYEEELAGPNGMHFTLYPGPEHTAEDVARSKRWLRIHRDVVGIHTIRRKAK
jgi:hypothetical protein